MHLNVSSATRPRPVAPSSLQPSSRAMTRTRVTWVDFLGSSQVVPLLIGVALKSVFDQFTKVDELQTKVESKIDKVGADMKAEMKASFEKSDSKIDKVDSKIDKVDSKIDKVEAEMKAEMKFEKLQESLKSRPVGPDNPSLDMKVRRHANGMPIIPTAVRKTRLNK
jgi:hypothetical protein